MSRALSPPALSEPAAFEELPRGDIPTPQEATAILRFLTRAKRTPGAEPLATGSAAGALRYFFVMPHCCAVTLLFQQPVDMHVAIN
jgi:hypothetical protein